MTFSEDDMRKAFKARKDAQPAKGSENGSESTKLTDEQIKRNAKLARMLDFELTEWSKEVGLQLPDHDVEVTSKNSKLLASTTFTISSRTFFATYDPGKVDLFVEVYTPIAGKHDASDKKKFAKAVEAETARMEELKDLVLNWFFDVDIQEHEIPAVTPVFEDNNGKLKTSLTWNWRGQSFLATLNNKKLEVTIVAYEAGVPIMGGVIRSAEELAAAITTFPDVEIQGQNEVYLMAAFDQFAAWLGTRPGRLGVLRCDANEIQLETELRGKRIWGKYLPQTKTFTVMAEVAPGTPNSFSFNGKRVMNVPSEDHIPGGKNKPEGKNSKKS